MEKKKPSAKPIASAAKNQAAPVSPAGTKNPPSSDEIRKRAYQNFINRGGTHGNHEEDWLRAEKELLKEKK